VNSVKVKEEGNALMVEKHIEKEVESAEPDA
jgi:hypothetical protein